MVHHLLLGADAEPLHCIRWITRSLVVVIEEYLGWLVVNLKEAVNMKVKLKTLNQFEEQK